MEISELKTKRDVILYGMEKGLDASHATRAEYLFDIELNNQQKDAINSCMDHAYEESICWERGSGASFCRMIESLYLATVYNYKNVVVVFSSLEEMSHHFNNMEKFLQEKEIVYYNSCPTYAHKGIVLTNECSVLFLSLTNTRFEGCRNMQIHKILGDNVDWKRHNFEYYKITKNSRFYKTY